MEPVSKHKGIKCAVCGDLIVSEFRHDFKYCTCHNVFVDGGFDYLRCGGSGVLDGTIDVVNVIPDPKQEIDWVIDYE